MGVTALVSSIAVASRPDEPPVDTATTGQTTTVQVPNDVVVPESDRIRNVRVVVRCDSLERCVVNPTPTDSEDSYSFRICPGGCAETRDDTFTLQSGSTSDRGGELLVAKGFRRVSPTTDEVAAVLASETVNDNFYRASLDEDNRIVFQEVGDADMTVTVRYTDASEIPTTQTGDNDNVDALFAAIVIVTMLIVGGLVLAGLATAIKLLVVALLGAASSGSARMTETDDEEDDDDEPDVDAPLALPQPITREVAEERAAVARDLLDRVRDIDDPRLSIQTGFSLLETGFGRVHLARRRNETSNAYIARVFGDHEELRPEMVEISGLFQRARFSDMPVDGEMRAVMIAKLESVQETWEREAFLLTDHVPAAPTGEAVRFRDEDDDFATYSANANANTNDDGEER